MYILIDFKFEDFNTGIDVNFDKFYKVRNNKNGETKWIDEYTFDKFQSLGLIEYAVNSNNDNKLGKRKKKINRWKTQPNREVKTINDEEVRRITKEHSKPDIESNKKEIISKIQRYAGLGFNTCFVSIYEIYSETLEYLKEKGFHIIEDENVFKGQVYRIVW